MQAIVGRSERRVILGILLGGLGLLGAVDSGRSADVPSVEHGFQPERVFQAGEIDNVRLLNGGLEIAIPLGIRYPVGGAGLSYGFTLHYGSQLWAYTQRWDQQAGGIMRTEAWPDGGSTSGFGWRLSLGEFWPAIDVADGRLCGFCYVDSSGARHQFVEELHSDVPGQPGIWFTNDGTYLRLRTTVDGWEIEFPSGEIHAFDESGRLVQMRDRFTNSVDIAHFANSWVVTDSEGRSHTVQLANVPHYGKAVSSLALSAFGGANQAVYNFSYETTIPVPRSCLDDDPVTTSPTVVLPLLTSVSIPDGGSSYQMPVGSYYLQPDVTCPDSASRQGLLQKVLLPTLGSISWAFGPYFFPVPTDGAPDTDFPPTWLSAVTGVVSRTLRRPDNSVEAVWSYSQTLPNGSASLESITSVTTPLLDRTDHFFNIGQQSNETYGLNFTPLTDGSPERPDLFLSTRVYDCDNAGQDCSVRRSTFQKYATSPLDPNVPFAANPRVVATSTRFHDDDNRWSATDLSSFDGLGHYRTATTSGNFDTGNARTTTTNFNPDSGTYPGSFTLPAAGDPWVLGRHDRVDTTEGGITSRVELCFSPAGFLQRTRTLKNGTARGAGDFLAVFVAGAKGERAEERYYGGDVTNNLDTNPSTPLCSVTLPTTEGYQVRNSISFGSLASSRYYADNTNPLPFHTVRREIDQRTGLVLRSFDISDIRTDYQYDLLGRLTWIKPVAGLNDGWTEHAYTRATGASSLAKLNVKRRDNGSEAGALMAETEYKFDGFGRLVEEARRMPGSNVWTSRQTIYNSQGLVASLSEWGNFARKTAYAGYDPFGRPQTITPADGATHAVTFLRRGVREVERTVSVGTFMSDPFEVGESPSTTIERYDRQGRLSRVTEPSGATGGNVTTTYTYDVGGRLKQASTSSGVTQNRFWNYDHRGTLASEQQPELGASGNGVLTYSGYDARGHATRKQDGVNDLTFVFDKAERMTLARETGGTQRTLKEFSYSGTAGSGLGKLAWADRYNYVTIAGNQYTGRVRESYLYAGRNGRVSDRTTQLFIGASLTETWQQGFEYTPLGDVDLIEYPYCASGGCVGGGPLRTVVYGFARGFLTSVVPESGANWASLTYHDNGMVKEVTHDRNGVVVTHAKDANSMLRPASIATSNVAGGSNWNTGSFVFDGAGNVVKIGDSVFLYDPVSRVKSALVGFTPAGFAPPTPELVAPEGLELIFADGFENGTTSAWSIPSTPTEGSQTFAYDAFGNLTNISGNPGRPIPTSASTNRVTGASYDAAGNMTSWAVPNGGGTNQYSYGPFHEVWRVATAGQEWVHIYTADDERLMSYQVGGTQKNRWTLRGLDNRVLREYVYDRPTQTGTIERDNIFRGAGPLLGAVTPAGERHYHVDHLGTPRQITDASGAQVAFHTYFPYGEEGTLPNQDAARYKFTGHERDFADPATPGDDHDHMHARMTNPQIGRFLSVDPVGGSPKAPQSWNRYSYVRGNPIKYVDPTGEFLTAAQIADKAYGLLEKVGVAASDAASDGSLLGAYATFQISNALDFASMGLDALRAGAAVGAAVGEGAGSVETALAVGHDALRVAGLVAPATGAVRSVASRTAVAEGTELFRVFGGEAQAAGRYYTTVNPNSVPNFRAAAGIFPENTGRFVLEGRLQSTKGVLSGPARPGPNGIGGGLPEVFVPNPRAQIRVLRVSGANPEF